MQSEFQRKRLATDQRSLYVCLYVLDTFFWSVIGPSDALTATCMNNGIVTYLGTLALGLSCVKILQVGRYRSWCSTDLLWLEIFHSDFTLKQ